MDGGLAPPSAHAARRATRRAELGVRNRLRSIAWDAGFVSSVRAACPRLAVYANERAGGWYVPDADGGAYFKSTDGHAGCVGFSPTRLNLHVPAAAAAAAAAADGGGVLLVDATRQGKTFPDALAVTVPVWAAVLNALLFPAACTDGRSAPPPAVCLPAWMARTSAGEEAAGAAAAAVARMPPGTAAAIRGALAGVLLAPLRLVWVSQGGSGPGGSDDGDAPAVVLTGCACADHGGTASAARLFSAACGDEEEDGEAGAAPSPTPAPLTCTPLFLLSASLPVPDEGHAPSLRAGWRYVPGAGDDAETWCPGGGLTPALLWAHSTALLAAGTDDDAVALAAALAAEDAGRLAKSGSGRADSGGAAVCRDANSGACDGGGSYGGDDEGSDGAGLLARLQRPLGREWAGVALLPAGVALPVGVRALGLRVAARASDWHVLLLEPWEPPPSAPAPQLAPTTPSDARDPNAQPLAHADGARGSCTVLRVPLDRRAQRRAEVAGDRVWQTAVLPAVGAVVRRAAGESAARMRSSGESGDAGGADARVAVMHACAALAPHAAAVAAAAALMLQGGRGGTGGGTGGADVGGAERGTGCDGGGGGGGDVRDIAGRLAAAGAPSSPLLVDKSAIRTAVAVYMATSGLPAVPRELQQQLNAWFYGP